MHTRAGVRVRVTVPASTANLGPGFDCIGLALSLHHTLIVSELTGSGVEISLTGEGSEALPCDETNPMFVAMSEAFEETGYRPEFLRMESNNHIPLARGLGSSAAATLAGLAAAAALAGGEVDRGQLLAQASAREGHADNVCASLFGGFCVTAHAAGTADFVRLPAPLELEAAVVVPDFELETIPSRAALPVTVPFGDAVANQARVALLTAAVASGEVELLPRAMLDQLHQPYRLGLVPGMQAVWDAAVEAGALGAALSGSGPSMVALVRAGDDAPGKAMQEAWKNSSIESRVLRLPFDDAGLVVEVHG